MRSNPCLRSDIILRISCTLLMVFLLLSSYRTSLAQQLLPLSGTHFTFGIIEGPDAIGGTPVTSILRLNVVSDQSGDGIILSPSGYQQRFKFDSVGVTAIDLDYNLMLLTDLGKSEKGLVVLTSQPVTLTIHDYAADAGDGTQLLPDEALDTSYVIAAWSIYNDTLYDTQDRENNHSEFLVTAPWDSTVVTITPTINTLDGHMANVPFVVTLNRGECYIVKADFNGRRANTSLVESRVTASKPVSVIVGLTCAYNPLAIESCNEIMDELIPRSAWGTEFNAAPLAPNGDEDILFFSSDIQNYTLQVNGGLTYFASSGHVEVPIRGPVTITTTVPAQCHELSEGSWFDFAGESDPSMVTVLPVGQYHDTLIWATPTFPFDFNYLSAVAPTTAIAQLQLDGNPLSPSVSISPISATMSALSIPVLPGRHILTSAQPIFGIANGFAVADAYTFGTGTATDSVPHFLSSAAPVVPKDSQIYCREFSVDVQSNPVRIDTNNSLQTITFNLAYDPAKLQLRSVLPYPILQNVFVTIDTSTIGSIRMTMNSPNPMLPTIRDAGSFFNLRFLSIDPLGSATDITNTFSYNSIFPDLPSAKATDTLRVQPLIVVDTSFVAMSIRAGSATLGSVDTATIQVGVISPGLGVKSFVLRIKYDHDILTLIRAVQSGTLTAGWTLGSVDSIDRETEQLTFTSNGDTLLGSGVLAQLLFNSFVSDSATALLQASIAFSTSRFCPEVLIAEPAQGLFLGRDLCGDAELRQVLGLNGLVINAILPNPTAGMFRINLNSGLSEVATVSVVNLLGRVLWTGAAYQLRRGQQDLTCLPAQLSEGSYIVRMETPTGVASRMLIVRK